ncbi:hypothetical protein D3C87_1026840 [compost metagenome]
MHAGLDPEGLHPLELLDQLGEIVGAERLRAEDLGEGANLARFPAAEVEARHHRLDDRRHGDLAFELHQLAGVLGIEGFRHGNADPLGHLEGQALVQAVRERLLAQEREAVVRGDLRPVAMGQPDVEIFHHVQDRRRLEACAQLRQEVREGLGMLLGIRADQPLAVPRMELRVRVLVEGDHRNPLLSQPPDDSVAVQGERRVDHGHGTFRTVTLLKRWHVASLPLLTRPSRSRHPAGLDREHQALVRREAPSERPPPAPGSLPTSTPPDFPSPEASSGPGRNL